jgi:hypothetical protein
MRTTRSWYDLTLTPLSCIHGAQAEPRQIQPSHCVREYSIRQLSDIHSWAGCQPAFERSLPTHHPLQAATQYSCTVHITVAALYWITRAPLIHRLHHPVCISIPASRWQLCATVTDTTTTKLVYYMMASDIDCKGTSSQALMPGCCCPHCPDPGLGCC